MPSGSVILRSFRLGALFSNALAQSFGVESLFIHWSTKVYWMNSRYSKLGTPSFYQVILLALG